MSDTPYLLGTKLIKLWKQQMEYNRPIIGSSTNSPIEWTQTYLLGLVDEVGGVLKELHWKNHRAGSSKMPDSFNIGAELADLTKFVFCLWQIWEFDVVEMLEFVEDKSNKLDALYRQEFAPEMNNEKILIVDLDGTIANYRKGYLDWAGLDSLPDPEETLNIAVDFNLPLNRYNEQKDEFESKGGYGRLPPYPDGLYFVAAAKEQGYKIIVVTARPLNLDRIWFDTVDWLKIHKVEYDQFYLMDNKDRVKKAIELRHQGNEVTMLDDNAQVALLASQADMMTIMRAKTYNKEVQGLPKVMRVNSYGQVLRFLRKDPLS